MLWWSGMLMKIASLQTYSLRNLIQNLPSPNSKCFLFYWGSLRFQKIMTLHFRWWALIIKKGKKHRSSSNLESAFSFSPALCLCDRLCWVFGITRGGSHWHSLGSGTRAIPAKLCPFLLSRLMDGTADRCIRPDGLRLLAA